jgi:hypothetical protein
MTRIASARIVSLLLGVGFIVACAPEPEIACGPEQYPATIELLYFGTLQSDGAVSHHEWADFIEHSVTPRFPQGLTFWSASGQWGTADGHVARERAYVLNLIYPRDVDNEVALTTVVNEYKARFRQEAVLRVKYSGCAAS